MNSLIHNLTQTNSSIKYSLIRVAMGIILMFISAQIQIPLNPVPITFHTVGVLIIAMTYKRSEALWAFMVYLIAGAFGAPMFSGFLGGFGILIGPKGGYYLGMLLCVYIITTMRKNFGENRSLHLAIYGIIGIASIYAVGVPWLAYFIGFEKAMLFGFIPFIFTGILKALFTAATIRILKQKFIK